MTIKYIILTTLLSWIAACGGESSSPPAADQPETDSSQSTAQQHSANVVVETANAADTDTPGKQVDYSAFAILGLEIGDEIDTVEEKIRASAPDLTITRAKMDISNVPGSAIRGMEYEFSLSAVSLNGAGQRRPYTQSIIATFSPPPGAPRLIGVLRSNPLEQPLVTADLAAQFIAKYGQPAFADENRLSWSVDAHGAPIRDTQRLRQCERAGNTRGRPYMNDMRASSQHLGPYAGCGFTFILMYQRDNNPDLVRGFNTLMYDIDLLTEYSDQTVAYSQAEAAKLRQAELDAARSSQGEVPSL